MLGESELILNSRGAVYHLDLLPGEIAETIFTVGDPGRVARISSHFDRVELKREHREFVTHTGFLAGQRLTVVSTGIGTDNIDIVLSELDALANLDLNRREIQPRFQKLRFIRLGTSGSLHSEVPIDSMVASAWAFGFDNLMHFYAHHNSGAEKMMLQAFKNHAALHQFSLVPYITSGASRLLDLFQPVTVRGITVTSPGFYAPQGRQLRAPAAYPHLLEVLSTFRYNGESIVNFEMETSGIYGLSAALGHDAVSISVIIAHRLSRAFSSDPEKSVERLIRMALERIVSS